MSAQLMPLFSILFFILCLGNAGTPLSLNFLGEFLSLYDLGTDSKNGYGQTPVSQVAENGHEAVVQLLESVTATALVQAQVNEPSSPPAT
jgi:NADH:ubiquinone oxidoreductase subunit 4 (subunit M)